MKINFKYLLYEIMSCIAVYFSFINLHMNSIKKSGKKILLFYLWALTLFLYPRYGQNITPVVLAGAMLIIALSEKKAALQNVSLSLTGYLIYVLIAYILSVVIELAGFSSSSFSRKHPVTIVVIVGFFTFIITFFLGRYLRKKFFSFSNVIPTRFSVLLLTEVFICTVIYIFNIMYGARYSYPKEIVYFNGTLILAFFTATMAVFCFAVRLIRKNCELQFRQREAGQLKEYTDKLEDINEQMRVFRHDYMNILATINGYIIDNDMPSLREYYATRIFPQGHIISENDILISRLTRIKIPELKGILYAKLIKAMSLWLNITLEIEEDIKNTRIDILDLAVVVGNLLDNAIEASAGTSDRILTVLLIKYPEHIHIVVENSVEGNVSLEGLADKNYTTKKDHVGLGLYHVQEILDGYPDICHKISCRCGVFRQSLEI